MKWDSTAKKNLTCKIYYVDVSTLRFDQVMENFSTLLNKFDFAAKNEFQVQIWLWNIVAQFEIHQDS